MIVQVVPDYIREGVEKWLNDLDKQLDSPMTKKDRENNRENLIRCGLRFNKLPPIKETIKQLKDLKKSNENQQTKQTVQTESGDNPEACENELSGSQQRVKTADLKSSEVKG